MELFYTFIFMREDYLHYLWQYQKFNHPQMKTSEGVEVKVISPGTHNHLSGPDFFNSRLSIGGQEWAGNVEIHLRSSDWYMHGHEQDPAYDNVILHVVWVHDVEVYRKDNSPLPVVEIRQLVDPDTVHSYENLCSNAGGRWINCENDFADIDDFLLESWLERLFVERLEKKTSLVNHFLERSAGDWEAVLFQMLAKNFGLNINGEAFRNIAGSIPFSVVRKSRGNLLQLEALLLGQAGLLEQECEEPYFLRLQEEYRFLTKKYRLDRGGVLPVKYFRLRPDNFPEIRLVQLASVYHSHSSLFSLLLKCSEVKDIYNIFNVEVSGFWNLHYTFSRSHAFRKKNFSRKFLDLLIINTVVPLKFTYIKSKGRDDFEEVFRILEAVACEENQVVNKFRSIRPGVAQNAGHSQALLHLKKEYCEQNACLRCAVGLKILQKEPQI